MMPNKFFILVMSFILLQFIQTNSISVEPEEMLQDKKKELRARIISQNIRCMVCQNESIDESNASLAKDLRILIRSQIQEGKNDKEIYKFLTERYGDIILLNPPLNLNTLVLWFLPFIFLIIGILVIFIHNKKYKKIK